MRLYGPGVKILGAFPREVILKQLGQLSHEAPGNSRQPLVVCSGFTWLGNVAIENAKAASHGGDMLILLPQTVYGGNGYTR